MSLAPALKAPSRIARTSRTTGALSAAPDPRLDRFELETWVGKDGRQARVIWMDGRPDLRARR